MKREVILFFLIFAFTGQIAFGQIEGEGRKNPIRTEQPEWIEVTPPLSAVNTLRQIPVVKNEPLQFALPLKVSYNPGNSGTIEERDGEKIWRVAIKSEGALSLNLILSPFRLPAGGYFYLFNGDQTIVKGPFGEVNNNQSGKLPLMPVPGEEIIFELHVPAGNDITKGIGISQVNHDYRGIFRILDSKDGEFGTSGPCNKDLACYPGTDYVNNGNSVARLIIGGSELCSGVLINNTSQENIPYLLTAEHCISNDSLAQITLFVFRYESPWCNGPDGRVFHSISGSGLRSTNPDYDFTLLELNQFPPITYKPYLAGWDRSGNQPPNSYSIHHPSGDVKKISFDNNPPVSSTYPTYAVGAFWKILQWEVGTTEGGSSGGPLFDNNNKVIGTLTGGEAACGNSVNDFFAKISRMSNASSLPASNLAPWIDPASSGVTALHGRDPYGPNHLTNDTLRNLPSEIYALKQYVLPGKGYSTGFNSDSVLLYAEYFENSRTAFITEVSIGLGAVSYVSVADSIRLYVFDDGPTPGAVLGSRRFLISETSATIPNKFDFGDVIPVSGNFYIGWRLWYKARAASETRQMAARIAPDQGGAEHNRAWLFHNGIWKPFTLHPSYPVSSSLDVTVIATGNSVVYSVNDPVAGKSSISLYPNPAGRCITATLPVVTDKITISIYNSAGQLVLSVQHSPDGNDEATFDISALNRGIYIMHFNASGISYSGKFIKH